MVRSFTDRVLGGVCGGIAAAFRVNAWIVRVIFVIGTVATLGAAALLYAALWIALPQGSLVTRRGGFGSLLLALLLTVLIIGGWIAERAGALPEAAAGQSVYLAAVVALFGLVILMRQVRA